MTYNWGIIEHDHLGRLRSRRDLDLAAVVRFANEHSVPGLAGLSFLRSIVWSLIGIEFATEKRTNGKQVSAMVMAEGVEALACWYAIDANQAVEGYANRIRGARKLPRIKAKDLTLKRLARGRGYVSQPIRMGMGACLPRLGLVDAENSRFNSFEMNDRGKEFLKLALGNQETARALPKLGTWLDGGTWDKKNTKQMSLISPFEPIPEEARKFFSALMTSAGDPAGLPVRRCLWRACSKLLSEKPGLEGDALVSQLTKRVQTTEPAVAARLIWADGFFSTYGAAFTVLEQVQDRLSATDTNSATIRELIGYGELLDKLNELKAKAQSLFALPLPASTPPGFEAFLHILCHGDSTSILHELISRDGTVLRLDEETRSLGVILHPDHKANTAPTGMPEAEDDPTVETSKLYRLYNLCSLCREVQEKA